MHMSTKMYTVEMQYLGNEFESDTLPLILILK